MKAPHAWIPSHQPLNHSSRPRARAFTLLEVLLAVVILTGLLSVVLFFYQQASRLRSDLLVEAERISAARLLMDRITTELRVARLHSFYETPLVGDSTFIQFITVGLPTSSAWTGESLGRISRPETDLKLVSYGARAASDGTNIIGLARAEEPLVERREVVDLTSVLPADAPGKSASMLLTEQLRALRFRYWNGVAWEASWSDVRLPSAVEVTLSSEALPDESEEPLFAETGPEIFRRVIYLPGSEVPAPAPEFPWEELE